MYMKTVIIKRGAMCVFVIWYIYDIYRQSDDSSRTPNGYKEVPDDSQAFGGPLARLSRSASSLSVKSQALKWIGD